MRRLQVMAVAVGSPAVLVAAILVGVGACRVVAPEAPLFGDPPARSIVEAITRGYGVEQAYAFIRDGQDPNALVDVDDDDYTGRREMRVSPLMLAVAARDTNTVQMLLNFGARLDLPQNRDAWCFANVLGDAATAAVLSQAGAPVAAHCPVEVVGSQQPPLWILEQLSGDVARR
jgi:hypothetical protein